MWVQTIFPKKTTSLGNFLARRFVEVYAPREGDSRAVSRLEMLEHVTQSEVSASYETVPFRATSLPTRSAVTTQTLRRTVNEQH